MVVDFWNLMDLKELGVHENLFELFVSGILVCLFILFLNIIDDAPGQQQQTFYLVGNAFMYRC